MPTTTKRTPKRTPKPYAEYQKEEPTRDINGRLIEASRIVEAGFLHEDEPPRPYTETVNGTVVTHN